jgi:hypothetical protein
MEKNPSNKTSLEILENLILNQIDKNAVMCLSMFQAMDAFESTRQKLIDDFFIKRELLAVRNFFRTGTKPNQNEFYFSLLGYPITNPSMKDFILDNSGDYIEKKIREEFKFALANEYNYHFFGGTDLDDFFKGCSEGNSFFGLPNLTLRGVSHGSHFLDVTEQGFFDFYKYQLQIGGGEVIDFDNVNTASKYLSKRESNFTKLIDEYISNYIRVIYSMMKVSSIHAIIRELHSIGITSQNEKLISEGEDDLYLLGTNGRKYYYQDPFRLGTAIEEDNFMFGFNRKMRTVFCKQIEALKNLNDNGSKLKYEYLIRLCDFRSVYEAILPEINLDPYYSS